MIDYPKGAFGWNLLWRLHGSAIYRAFFPGLIGCAFFLYLRLHYFQHHPEDEFRHPYAVGVLVSSISFLIIFRANHGYRRYWDSATSIHHMMSKWMDTACTAMCYHMQSPHYRHIRPPSYHDAFELDNKFITRNRERAHQRDNGESYEQRMKRRAKTKSINTTAGASKGDSGADCFDDLSDELRLRSKKRERNEPAPLLGKERLDGGWKGLFKPKNGSSPNSTFYDGTSRWNADGKGFASTSGGRTPALFLQELAHLASLLNAVALSTLRNDEDGAESPLDFYEPGSPWPSADGTHGDSVTWSEVFKYMTGADRSPEARTRYNASRPLSVLGGVSDAEIKFLQTARGAQAKTQLCSSWLAEFIIREHLEGSMPVHGAIMSRLFQYMGQGMTMYSQAHKVRIPLVHHGFYD